MILIAADFRPPLGWPVTLLLLSAALVAAVCIAARYEQRWVVLGLRLIGIAALGWLLLGPSINRSADLGTEQLPELILLVDRSLSMAEPDAELSGQSNGTARLDALKATWLSDETRGLLGEHARVRVVAFADQAVPTDPASLVPDGEVTKLYDALAAYPGVTTVLLSDGHDTSQEAGTQTPAAQTAHRRRVYTVPVGATQGAPDVSVQAWALSDRLFDGQSTQVLAQVYQRGFAGRRARVDLQLDGETIATQEIVLDAPLQQVSFEVQPTLGPREPARVHAYACEVMVLDAEESYSDNNTEDVFIQVTREKTRVLLVEGEPYWDTRSLARLVGSHPGYDLTAIFALGQDRQVITRGPHSPLGDGLTAEALRRFDVVVLGREVQRLMGPDVIEALLPYVRDFGGAVVFARGEAFDTGSDAGRSVTQQISPVTFGRREAQPLRLVVSEAAHGNPLTDLGGEQAISRLPGMIAATRVEGRQSASVVLLEQAGEGPDSAALATLRVGAGVSMAVLTDGLWRWELLPTEVEDLGSVYAVFWTRALQWLASGGEFLPGQDVSLTLDRLASRPGEHVTINVGTRYADGNGFDPVVQITSADGETAELKDLVPSAAGGFSAAFTPVALGVYRIELTTPGQTNLIDPAHPVTARLAVVDRSPERRDTSARPDVLRSIAEATGGRCLALDETRPVIDYLREIAVARQADSRPEYRFARWPVMALVFAAFGLEWFLRRRGGLL